MSSRGSCTVESAGARWRSISTPSGGSPPGRWRSFQGGPARRGQRASCDLWRDKRRATGGVGGPHYRVWGVRVPLRNRACRPGSPARFRARFQAAHDLPSHRFLGVLARSHGPAWQAPGEQSLYLPQAAGGGGSKCAAKAAQAFICRDAADGETPGSSGRHTKGPGRCPGPFALRLSGG
jgi:hypothetical protein